MHAHTIFTNLLGDAQEVNSRIGLLGNRMAAIDQQVPQIESMFRSKDPSHFYAGNQTQGKDWRRKDRPSFNMFAPETQPQVNNPRPPPP